MPDISLAGKQHRNTLKGTTNSVKDSNPDPVELLIDQAEEGIILRESLTQVSRAVFLEWVDGNREALR